MNKLLIPIPENESERLESLASYNVLDTSSEVDFDELTLLASEICQTPIALISLVDEKRQWFKSNHGLDARETPREQAFCAHTIINPNEVMVVNDARYDERFSHNPLVTGNPNIVFYAGVPLLNENGYALGSLCVIDKKPKELTEGQLKSLQVLAKQVLTQMELRKKLHIIQKANNELIEANAFIQNFATTAAHDIKNPLSSIMLTSQALQTRLKANGDEKSRNLVELTLSSSKKLMSLVDEMLHYSSSPGSLISNTECVNIHQMLTEVVAMIDVPQGININIKHGEGTLICSGVALEQIFLNLLTNAVRYNDKEEGRIEVSYKEDGDYFAFKVADNGMGIAEKNQQKIFEKDVILNVVDRFNKKGTGIGLYTVKSLVEKLRGSISIESRIGLGTTFNFTIKKNALLEEGELANV